MGELKLRFRRHFSAVWPTVTLLADGKKGLRFDFWPCQCTGLGFKVYLLRSNTDRCSDSTWSCKSPWGLFQCWTEIHSQSTEFIDVTSSLKFLLFKLNLIHHIYFLVFSGALVDQWCSSLVLFSEWPNLLRSNLILGQFIAFAVYL